MLNRVKILVSYPYFNKRVLETLRSIPTSDYELMVDSGAFTAWNLGKTVSLDSYCQFLDSIKELMPFHAIQLDVVGDPKTTWDNYTTMIDRGYKVMPVFTRGGDLDLLEAMYEKTDYILLGGIARGKDRLEYLRWVMNRNKKRKVHWLGCSHTDLVKQYKPTSIDSSSWASAGRFGGGISLYKGNGELFNLRKDTLKKKPSRELLSLFARNKASRDEIIMLQNKKSWRGGVASITNQSLISLISLRAYLLLAIDIETKTNTKSFFVCTDSAEIGLVIKTYKEIQDE